MTPRIGKILAACFSAVGGLLTAAVQMDAIPTSGHKLAMLGIFACGLIPATLLPAIFGEGEPGKIALPPVPAWLILPVALLLSATAHAQHTGTAGAIHDPDAGKVMLAMPAEPVPVAPVPANSPGKPDGSPAPVPAPVLAPVQPPTGDSHLPAAGVGNAISPTLAGDNRLIPIVPGCTEAHTYAPAGDRTTTASLWIGVVTSLIGTVDLAWRGYERATE